uniref:CSON005717 protein n=1 Tax=Culicoides sonorensis TaxID=179676 RepID=A0A336L9D5_CULSO
MKYLLALLFCVSAVLAAPKINEEQSYNPIVQYFKGCFESVELGTCLAVKGISILNRAARAQSIELVPGIMFSKKENVALRSAKSMSENEIITALEGETGEKSGRLIDMALEAGSNFLITHDIQIKIPSETTEQLARALDEGRGKKKNKMGGMMMAFGAKMMAMLPLALIALKFLVLKALVVSKIAFFLALMLSASKLMGSGGSFGSGILGKVVSI